MRDTKQGIYSITVPGTVKEFLLPTPEDGYEGRVGETPRVVPLPFGLDELVVVDAELSPLASNPPGYTATTIITDKQGNKIGTKEDDQTGD